MNTTYIMLKDIPVLEVKDYRCNILNYELLPISLRYNELKEENGPLTWKQISLFQNPLEKAVSSTALFGVSQTFGNLEQKIHTPELSVQGMAAKAWIMEKDGLYLYKVGKKELPASQILDALNIPHVGYREAEASSLERIAAQAYISKIYDNKEKVVKCKIISSEETALVPWEDFQVYCSYHDKNEYDIIKQMDPSNYYSMQVADYILGNEDRHGANFGFYMDNQTGTLSGLYPLMDHDHAFSEEEAIPSQTWECDGTLRQAALEAIKYASVDFDRVLKMKRPEDLEEGPWSIVLGRCLELQRVKERFSNEENK